MKKVDVSAVPLPTLTRRNPLWLVYAIVKIVKKFTGSAFSFLVAVAEDDLEVEGDLQTFSKPGDSGQPIHRQFCPQCGSSISEIAYTRPGLVLLNGGTLHSPDELTPSIQIYCDRVLPWAVINSEIVRFPGAPE